MLPKSSKKKDPGCKTGSSKVKCGGMGNGVITIWIYSIRTHIIGRWSLKSLIGIRISPFSRDGKKTVQFSHYLGKLLSPELHQLLFSYWGFSWIFRCQSSLDSKRRFFIRRVFQHPLVGVFLRLTNPEGILPIRRGCSQTLSGFPF